MIYDARLGLDCCMGLVCERAGGGENQDVGGMERGE